MESRTMEALEAGLTLLESALTSVAIIVAGVWGYYLFWKKRGNYPRVTLAIEIASAELPRYKRLVHLALHISNTSDILLPLEYIEVRLRQVVPTPPGFDGVLAPNVDPIPAGLAEYPWPAVVQRESRFDPKMEIEPGETDSHHVDFVIDDEVRVAEVYAFVQNPRKALGFGWPITLLYTFDETTNMREPKKIVPVPTDWNEKQQRQQPRQPAQQAQQQTQQQVQVPASPSPGTADTTKLPDRQNDT